MNNEEYEKFRKEWKGERDFCNRFISDEIQDMDDYLNDFLPGCYTCRDISNNLSIVYKSGHNTVQEYITLENFEKLIQRRQEKTGGKCWCLYCDNTESNIYDCEIECMYEAFFWNNSERCLEMRETTKNMSHLQLKNYYNSFGEELSEIVPFRVFKKFMNKSKCWCGKCIEGKDPYKDYMKIKLSNEYDEQIRQYCANR